MILIVFCLVVLFLYVLAAFLFQSSSQCILDREAERGRRLDAQKAILDQFKWLEDHCEELEEILDSEFDTAVDAAADRAERAQARAVRFRALSVSLSMSHNSAGLGGEL